MSKQEPIAVLGAGAWGTALAIHLARNNHPVRLWGRDPEMMSIMEQDRCNTSYLPDISFPNNLEICPDLASAINNIRDILIAVPSHAVTDLLQQIAVNNFSNRRVVWATKGLSAGEKIGSGKFIHEIIEDILGPDTPTAVLSGPSFAKEVARGLPVAVVIASHSDVFSKDLVGRFHGPSFRVYQSDDLLGVQICGAVKNVIAVAAGIADGMELGASARCALITRGLAEMSRLARTLGAKPQTCAGLAGVGDLLLTCSSDLSRNRRFGLALGQNKTLAEASETVGGVVESIYNAEQIYYLAKQQGIEMPITEQVYRVLEKQCSLGQAFNALVNRAPTSEAL